MLLCQITKNIDLRVVGMFTFFWRSVQILQGRIHYRSSLSTALTISPCESIESVDADEEEQAQERNHLVKTIPYSCQFVSSNEKFDIKISFAPFKCVIKASVKESPQQKTCIEAQLPTNLQNYGEIYNANDCEYFKIKDHSMSHANFVLLIDHLKTNARSTKRSYNSIGF